MGYHDPRSSRVDDLWSVYESAWNSRGIIPSVSKTEIFSILHSGFVNEQTEAFAKHHLLELVKLLESKGIPVAP